MTAVRCFRFPCDTAYMRGKHEVDRTGLVRHQTRVDEESVAVDDLDRPWALVWRVSVIALGSDGDWKPVIEVPSGARAFANPDEAERLSAAFVRAQVWAMKANLREAQDALEPA